MTKPEIIGSIRSTYTRVVCMVCEEKGIEYALSEAMLGAPEIRAMCGERRLPLHVFPWRPETGRTGLRRDTVYLVRPDGYLGLVDPAKSTAAVTSYLDARKITPRV